MTPPNKMQELCEVLGSAPHLVEMAAAVSGAYRERRPYTVEDGIAMIDVAGLLSRDSDRLRKYGWASASSYEDIALEAMLAADDPEVRGILLRVNSPGGESTGAFEAAAEIRAAAAKKPLWAVADPIAFSGGYLLASAASRIYIPQYTKSVGSIGVYSIHMDLSEMLAQAGIKTTIISAGKGKTSGNPYEPLDEETRKEFQAEIDRLYGEFVAAVSASRGMDEEEIRGLGAAMLHGAAAKRAGLADEIGSSEKAASDLREYIAGRVHGERSTSMAAVAAVTPHKEASRMPEPNIADTTAAPAVTTPQPPVASTPSQSELIAAARADGYEAAGNIIALCQAAGVPMATAAGYIQARKSITEVCANLLEARAASDGEATVSQTTPTTNAGDGSDQDPLGQMVAQQYPTKEAK